MQLHPHQAVLLGEHLDSVDMAEVGQESHQIGFGVYDVAYAVSGPNQESHFRALFRLLRDVDKA